MITDNSKGKIMLNKSQMNKAQKKELIDFSLSFNPEFFITLVFRSDIKRKTAYESMVGFINKMNNFFFTRKSKEELRLLPVLEMGRARYEYDGCDLDNVEANWHLHLIIENPINRNSRISEIDIEELKKLIGNLWGSTPYGDVAFSTRYYNDDWFKPIHDIERLTYYLNKEIHAGNETAVCYELANNTGVKQDKSSRKQTKNL